MLRHPRPGVDHAGVDVIAEIGFEGVADHPERVAAVMVQQILDVLEEEERRPVMRDYPGDIEEERSPALAAEAVGLVEGVFLTLRRSRRAGMGSPRRSNRVRADAVRGAPRASPWGRRSMLGGEAAVCGLRALAHTFTTLRHPAEKLLEAEHFLGRLVVANGLQFQFELNALLSASRSVTFVLQRALAHVPSFAGWYEQKQAHMSDDPAMRFFVKLRNISQKDGPVSFVGGSLLGGGWTYRFVGGPEALPDELVGRDIGACCAASGEVGKAIVGLRARLSF